MLLIKLISYPLFGNVSILQGTLLKYYQNFRFVLSFWHAVQDVSNFLSELPAYLSPLFSVTFILRVTINDAYDMNFDVVTQYSSETLDSQ